MRIQVILKNGNLLEYPHCDAIIEELTYTYTIPEDYPATIGGSVVTKTAGAYLRIFTVEESDEKVRAYINLTNIAGFEVIE